MKLRNLLEGIPYVLLQGNIEESINHLVIDSRKVEEKDLFICIRGVESDGHHFINQAIAKGATAILVENRDEDFSDIKNVVVLYTEDTRKALAVLSANSFNHPSKELKMIGITGTKGKTTTACMVKTILEKAGHKTGMIGTMGVFYGKIREEISNTTPDALALHCIFRKMLDNGCTHVVMETSSQGFKQYRTEGIIFDYGLFLNIDYDHIGENEHANFEEYLNCKKQLFKQSKKMILNKGDRLFEKLNENEKKGGITYSTKEKADYYINNYKLIQGKDYLGSSFELQGKIQYKMNLKIPGEYNIGNALAAIALADQIGVSKKIIVDAFKNLEIEGRTQLIKGALEYQRTVLVDFAHNGISMKSMLEGLRAYQPHKIICIFGMRWNETRMRRFDMGVAAGKYADLIILTEDNIGDETLESINEEIIKGIGERNKKYEVISNRRMAIRYALDHSGSQDFVVLVGKGHEHYQEIKGKIIYLSEEDVVIEHLKSKNINRLSECKAS